MTESADVAVIGAGIVGASSAIHLQMRGKKVVLIDRKDPGQETSYGNAGLLETSCLLPYGFPALNRIPGILMGRDPMARVQYASLPFILPWILDFYLQSQTKLRQKNGVFMRPLTSTSIDEHRTLMRNTDLERYLLTNCYCRLYRTERSFLSDALGRRLAKERGVPFEIFDRATFSEIEPELKPIYTKVVRWTSAGRLSNPGAVTAGYAARFTSEGGSFQRTEVKKLAKDEGGSWKIETTSKTLEAKEIVICAGPWSNDILKSLGYHFPLGFKRGYHQHFRAVGSAKLQQYLSDVEASFALMPMEQGYRLTTGAEFAFRDAKPNPVQIEQTLRRARELFPLGDAIEPTPWMGSRPCFTDSLPVIGAATGHKGLWFNFGHGHLGMTMGPPSARLLAEMMTKTTPFCDPSPYRAERFGC